MQQPAIRLHRAIPHLIPGFHHDVQVAYRPELPATYPFIRGNHLIWTTATHTLLQRCSLLPPHFEGVFTLPVRTQPRQALLLLLLRPFPNPPLTPSHTLLNMRCGNPTAIQSHCLQPSQRVGTTGSSLGLLECCLFFVCQLELSLCHTLDYASGGIVYP